MWFRPLARRVRLGLEALEARDVPAVYNPLTSADLINSMAAANVTPEADVITLSAGVTYTLTGVNNTEHGATGLPVVAAGGGGLTILGNGAVVGRSVAAGTPVFRLFDVAPGASLTIQDLTLTGGLALQAGGAIYSYGALSLTDAVVQDCTAFGTVGTKAGGRGGVPAGRGGDAFGGGVYVGGGTADLTRVTLRNNTARGGQGGAGSSSRLDGDLPGGPGGNGYGGGLYVGGGTATLLGTSVTKNSAVGGAGGPGGGKARDGVKGSGIGGGVYLAPGVGFTQTDSAVTHNTASTSNKDIFVG